MKEQEMQKSAEIRARALAWLKSREDYRHSHKLESYADCITAWELRIKGPRGWQKGKARNPAVAAKVKELGISRQWAAELVKRETLITR